VCHALLQDPNFFRLLLRVDQELALARRVLGCACGGVLHGGDYPRKPRGCPIELRADFSSRFSFCCNRCRTRATPASVRFLGRRVYLALAVVLMSAPRPGPAPTAAAIHAATVLEVPVRTLQRWRQWWQERLPLTAFWQAASARFVPPVLATAMPGALLARFVGTAAESLLRMLVFLSPLTVALITLGDGG
jgi:hypothetical protein